jgi:predicted transcriptional regulator
MDIEDVLCSKTRLKILNALINSELTPSDIAKTVGVNYADANEHLKILEAAGIISHIKFGKRIRYFKFNEASHKAQAIRHLIETF